MLYIFYLVIFTLTLPILTWMFIAFFLDTCENNFYSHDFFVLWEIIFDDKYRNKHKNQNIYNSDSNINDKIMVSAK